MKKKTSFYVRGVFTVYVQYAELYDSTIAHLYSVHFI